MRIKQFNKLLGMASEKHILKNCCLVIDGQNYMYNMYEHSKLSSEAGCECDRFADFLRSQLAMFKKANVKCYFVFKGASTDVQKRYEKNTNSTSHEKNSASIFVKNIWRQVIEEVGFDYVICKLEAKEQCAVLASELRCPVMSNDIEVGLLSESYVNYVTLKFNPQKQGIECKLLRFTNFLKIHRLSRDKFSIFLLLAVENVFPENYFSEVLEKIKAPESIPDRYVHIMKWLATRPRDSAMDEILRKFGRDDRKSILLKEHEMDAILNRKPAGIPCQYFLQKHTVFIKDNDPQWFEKGIALRHISIPFIYLYTDCFVDGSWGFDDATLPDAILLCTDIMKYALNLMHNYRKSSFKIYSANGDIIEVNATMPDVPKPNYTVCNVVFENGWSRIKQLNLFKHFLTYTMRGVNWNYLSELPEDARMLMIALIYMTHKNRSWGEREAYSVMLSFVTLRNGDGTTSDRRAVEVALKSFLNKNHIIKKDVVYPLFQFQHCLELLNDLNVLCGHTYKCTDYGRTYNGKLVYNFLEKFNSMDTDAIVLISQLLLSAPNTLNFFEKLVATHKKMKPFNI